MAGVPGYRSFYEFHVSEAAQGASGAGIYHHQCDCQYLWAWLGSDAGGTEGHGSAQRSGRGTAAYRKNRAENGTASNEMCTFLVLNIASLRCSGEYYRISESVRQYESGGNSGAVSGGDTDQCSDSGSIL